MNFQHSLDVSNDDEDGQFRKFTAIADKFIKRNAPLEINICSRVTARIMGSVDDEAAFKKLGKVRGNEGCMC